MKNRPIRSWPFMTPAPALVGNDQQQPCILEPAAGKNVMPGGDGEAIFAEAAELGSCDRAFGRDTERQKIGVEQNRDARQLLESGAISLAKARGRTFPHRTLPRCGPWERQELVLVRRELAIGPCRL